jgi:hypothetical protein
MRNKEKSETFSAEETDQRFKAALRGARLVGQKPLKDIPKRNGESRVKVAKKAKRGARKS